MPPEFPRTPSRGALSRALLVLAVTMVSRAALATEDAPDAAPGFFARQWSAYKNAWSHGSSDLYLTGWTHHDRDTYSPEKIASFNERAWGAGYGVSTLDERGNRYGWQALGFRDSHNHVTMMAGLSYLHYWPGDRPYGAGLGYTLFLASRPDIYNGVPFPGVLPLGGLKAGPVEVLGTYVPKINRSSTGNGNVAFVFMRIHF